MILSMTGYADAQISDGDTSYAIEIKTVNNRYFKASIKLPEQLSIFEPEVEKLLRTRLSRGSVTYTLRVRNNSLEAAQDINTAALESYLRQLERVAHADHIRIDLATILALPGICQPPEIDEDVRHHQWNAVSKLTHQAMEQLIQMRQVEGRAIREDLLSQCQTIRQNLELISGRAPEVLREYHQKLLQRTNELLSEGLYQLKLDDLRREIALYAERCDINEEISRLSTHLDQFEKLCDSTERAGRKLDFLSQELLREANTIGSKSNDAEIARCVVEIKSAIDRLKEQVQNIE